MSTASRQPLESNRPIYLAPPAFLLAVPISHALTFAAKRREHSDSCAAETLRCNVQEHEGLCVAAQRCLQQMHGLFNMQLCDMVTHMSPSGTKARGRTLMCRVSEQRSQTWRRYVSLELRYGT